MRRLRRDDFSRRLVRENLLSADDLIYPVFILEGKNRIEPIASMPGIVRQTLDKLLYQAEQCVKLGIPAIALFPVIAQKLKNPDATEAFNPQGLVPRVVNA
ncbi:MAG: porphobilinogen synthase, partial [Burkholderiales bacterium]